MNCHRARQLISPYLDDQLTGQQMLALQEHFGVCASCEAERQSIRQVKRLLRSLHQPQPRLDFSQAVAAHAESRPSPPAFWKDVWQGWFPAHPPRGRRLVASLALSCLTVFAVAGPFAPASQDGAFRAAGFPLPTRSQVSVTEAPAQPGPTSWNASPPADLRPAGLQVLTESDESRRERLFAAQYAQPTQPETTTAPLNDDAVRSFVQGDAAFVGYRTR